jgi:DNA-nicking Smr family endonuclease
MAKDAELFVKAMTDVKPLKRSGRAVARPAPADVPRLKAEEPLKSKPRSAATIGTASRPKPPPPEPELEAGSKHFDRDVDRALSRGRLEPEARLDLHGMTLATAERAVARFLEHAAARDFRVALVITGKGFRREDGRVVEGRIRAEFVGWLNRPENRARVRGVRAAHPRHGGSGAFYVLLRRRSSANKRSLRATPQR